MRLISVLCHSVASKRHFTEKPDLKVINQFLEDIFVRSGFAYKRQIIFKHKHMENRIEILLTPKTLHSNAVISNTNLEVNL
jgi:hypothetical protein